jgi:hypothetical protein
MGFECGEFRFEGCQFGVEGLEVGGFGRGGGGSGGGDSSGTIALGGTRAWRSWVAMVDCAKAKTGRNAKKMPTATRTFIYQRSVA